MENSEMPLFSKFKNVLKVHTEINHNINSFLKLNTGSRANQFESEKRDHKNKKEQLRRKRDIPPGDWELEQSMELEFGEAYKRDFETLSNKDDEDAIRVKYPRLKEVVDAVRLNSRTTVSFRTGTDVSLNQLGNPSLIHVRTVQEINSLPYEIFQRLLTTANDE